VELKGMLDPLEELHAAEQSLRAGVVEESFSRLNRLKEGRVRQRGLDYLRALCFLEMGHRQAAIEAAKEELRFFNHPKAKLLLDWLAPQIFGTPVCGDEEFQAVYAAVRSFTMVGEPRLWSLFSLAKDVCERDVPGDFFECGVAAGGSGALLAVVMHRYSKRDRRLFAFDTFEGMPAPTPMDTYNGQPANDTGWGTGTCAAPESSLLNICRTLDVEELIQPVKGLFADTLPKFRDRPIALLHMDGDWYRSTLDVLENLYDRVVAGGRIQIDDYGHWEGCRRAVHEFVSRRGLAFMPHEIDYGGVWVAK
jgi:hypothetical protein